MGGRTYGGRSADERHALQRRRFLDAGLELFGTIGFRATTVRALCREAGLTDRYFYKNFDHMEACLIAVYTEAIAALERKVVAALATHPMPTPRSRRACRRSSSRSRTHAWRECAGKRSSA